MTTTLTDADLIAIASDLQTRATQITSSIGAVPNPAPGPVTGFMGRSTVDTSIWSPKPLVEDEFLTLAPEAKFLSAYGTKWDAYPTSYQTTDKKGYYDPNRISVIDTPDGFRVLNCHLVPGSKNANGKPSGTAAQPKINGSASNGTKGEKVELRVRCLDPSPNWHDANLGWVLKDSDWPYKGENDYLECDLTATIGAFLHLWQGTSGSDQVHFSTNARLNDGWHVVGFERRPVNGVWTYAWFLDGKEVLADDRKSRLNSRVPQDYFRQVLQIENSGLPTKESNMQYDSYTCWQLAS